MATVELSLASESWEAGNRAHRDFMQRNGQSRWEKATLKAFDEMCQKGLTKWPSWYRGNVASQKNSTRER